MSRLQYILILFLFMSACKKLDSEQIFLKSSCESCKAEVEKYLLSLKGVYYANFDVENELLIFHFDREDSKLEAEDWLIENGFVQSADSNLAILPECCPKPDSLKTENEE